MAINRAQVSLSFEDEELYNNLIVHLKKTKTLQKTILDCLTAYYYNDTVRQIVSGIEDEIYEDGQVEDRDTIFANMRNALLVNEFIMNEFSNELENSMADVADIVEAVGEDLSGTPTEGTTTPSIAQVLIPILESKAAEQAELESAEETPETQVVATEVSHGMPSVSTNSSDEKLNLLISMMQTMMEKGHFVSDVAITPEVEEKEPELDNAESFLEEPESVIEEITTLEEPTLEEESTLEDSKLEEEEVVESKAPRGGIPSIIRPHVPTPPHVPIAPVAPVAPVEPITVDSDTSSVFDDADDDFDNWDIDAELATVNLSEEEDEDEDEDVSVEIAELFSSLDY